ncbi:hypothetical protein CVT24_003279 [Panaeolus cyanescens]|uniref:Uncharacterized protein n=1 Tax=Panaeolus cyanescens TaxID=181874 RepID=A0A409YRA2_9AGAR|nr:hypothetical protein CVT24_003279 [Panaeolus cyanescens]
MPFQDQHKTPSGQATNPYTVPTKPWAANVPKSVNPYLVDAEEKRKEEESKEYYSSSQADGVPSEGVTSNSSQPKQHLYKTIASYERKRAEMYKAKYLEMMEENKKMAQSINTNPSTSEGSQSSQPPANLKDHKYFSNILNF